jgi:redox-sensitive bicupin YhaK (pirin superfamily)
MDSRVAAEECTSINRAAVFETYRSRETSLAELAIWRALPVRGRRLIGPWCFLDRYGPVTFEGRKPMDVAPHPHIGLQTVSWLLDGEVIHHDSLGCEALVRPGGVNVMTAGRGIAHSEETPGQNSGRLNGVQLWTALPDEERNREPSFQHIAEVPKLDLGGGVVQLFAGRLASTSSPSTMFSPGVGADIEILRGSRLSIPVKETWEHGFFVLEGDAAFEGHELERNVMAYVGCGRSEVVLRSRGGASVLLIGGEPFPEPVLMWWNFAARTPEEIAAARSGWEEGTRFGGVPGYKGPRIPAPPLSRLATPNPAS